MNQEFEKIFESDEELKRLIDDYEELNDEVIEQLIKYKEKVLLNITIDNLFDMGIPATPQQVFSLAILLNEIILKLTHNLINDKKLKIEKEELKENIENLIRKQSLSGLSTDDLLKNKREELKKIDDEIREIKERIETYETLISSYKNKINLCVELAKFLAEEIKNIKKGL